MQLPNSQKFSGEVVFPDIKHIICFLKVHVREVWKLREVDEQIELIGRISQKFLYALDHWLYHHRVKIYQVFSEDNIGPDMDLTAV